MHWAEHCNKQSSIPSGGIKIYKIIGVEGVGFWQYDIYRMSERLIKPWLMNVDWWLPMGDDHMLSIKNLERTLSSMIQKIS